MKKSINLWLKNIKIGFEHISQHQFMQHETYTVSSLSNSENNPMLTQYCKVCTIQQYTQTQIDVLPSEDSVNR